MIIKPTFVEVTSLCPSPYSKYVDTAIKNLYQKVNDPVNNQGSIDDIWPHIR